MELLGYCITTFGKNIYEDWDWHLGILDLASSIVKTESEGNKVIALIDKPMESYTKERAQLIKFEILLRMKGTKEAEDFINQNLANSRLRTIAIESAIKDKNYEKAIGIARDGVRYDAKDKPDLVYTWYDWLLKIATIQKDTDRMIEYARILFVDSNELVEMYSTGIVYLLKICTNRGQYQEACRYLRRMIKLGGKDKCDNLMMKIRAEYPRRSALLDELSRV